MADGSPGFRLSGSGASSYNQNGKMDDDATNMTQADILPTGAWELPEELRTLRETVRRFMTQEVCPVEEHQPHDAYKLPADELACLQEKARTLGLWCPASPAEYGGGLGLLAQALVAEKAAKCRMGAHVPACGAFGSEEQRRKYGVEGIARGKNVSWRFPRRREGLIRRGISGHGRCGTAITMS